MLGFGLDHGMSIGEICTLVLAYGLAATLLAYFSSRIDVSAYAGHIGAVADAPQPVSQRAEIAVSTQKAGHKHHSRPISGSHANTAKDR